MIDNRQKYKCECPCGYVFYACKSIAHEMGSNYAGIGNCPSCKVFNNLTFDKENQCMIVTPWEMWIKEGGNNK